MSVFVGILFITSKCKGSNLEEMNFLYFVSTIDNLQTGLDFIALCVVLCYCELWTLTRVRFSLVSKSNPSPDSLRMLVL